jgi:predicted TIM-barrel fold metal-dependent hydrolase
MGPSKEGYAMTSIETDMATPSGAAEALRGVAVVDADSHITEPPDLWTSRLPARWREHAPRVIDDPDSGLPKWLVGEHLVAGATFNAHAGWSEYYPSVPPTLEEADPASWDPVARLERLDEYGIDVQMLYPNLIGFFIWAFRALPDPQIRLDCIRAYNDFQAEFAATAPDRYVAIMNLPFWDLDASLAELRRCVDSGHKGVNMGWEFEKQGLPPLRDEHWVPLLSEIQDIGLPISFHIGFNESEASMTSAMKILDRRDLAIGTALFFIGNARCIAELVLGGVCHRFPTLNFVSVESGFGYVPWLLQALDWQFMNTGIAQSHPDYLLPSEYFSRQVHTTIWFEHDIERLVDRYEDNVMFSSDFPHPTSLSPGPASTALSPRATIDANLGMLPDATMRKLVHDNAARLYGLD